MAEIEREEMRVLDRTSSIDSVSPDDFLDLADKILEIQERFVDGREMYLEYDDASEFKVLAIEAKALFAKAFGRLNDYSIKVESTLFENRTELHEGPTVQAVADVVYLLRQAASDLKSRQTGPARVPPERSYVDPTRMASLEALQSDWDFTRLLELCRELNLAAAADCHMSVVFLVRAIADHLPPVFGCSTFQEVVNNYPGGRSFKSSMAHLQNSLRNVADQYLHQQIRRREALPTRVGVNYSQDLDVLLGEVIRIADEESPPDRSRN